MVGLDGHIEPIAVKALSKDNQDRLVMKSNMHGFELLLVDGENTVGIPISISMFHATEDFEQKWLNVFRNLADLRQQALDNDFPPPTKA